MSIDLDSTEHDRACDLMHSGGPFEPDCGCFRRAAAAEIERLRAELEAETAGAESLGERMVEVAEVLGVAPGRAVVEEAQRLRAEHEEVEFQLRGGWDEDGPAASGLDGLDLSEIANVLHSTAVEKSIRVYELEAERDRLVEGIRKFVERHTGPQGMGGNTFLVDEVRALLDTSDPEDP